MLFDNDGKELRVKRIEFDPFNDVWRFVVQKGSLDLGTFYYRPEYVCLEKPITPDSWEKLLDDLDKAAGKTYCGTCTYFGKKPTDCDTCEIGDISACDSAAMRDIASRIRKLRGEDDV